MANVEKLGEVTQTATARPMKLSEMVNVRGESRKVADSHSDAEERVAVRLVRVETGGVDRTTGEAVKVFYEVTAKVPGHEESTRIYNNERNAELVFLAAQYGVVDLSTPLYALPSKLWRAYRDEGAFRDLEAKLDPGLWLMGIRPTCWPTPEGLPARHERTDHMAKVGLDAAGTRISSGDSHADLASRHKPDLTDLPDRGGLFREVPVEELRAEEAAVLAPAGRRAA